MRSNEKFYIYHDRELPLCVVGHSMLSNTVYASLNDIGNVVQLPLEQLFVKTQSWFDSYQFIVLTADTSFKKQAVEFLQSKNAHFFSLVNKFNNLATDIKIGQGTYIDAFNSMMVADIHIGNHAIVCTHNTLGRHCQVGDYGYISHHGFFNRCKIGSGTVIGTNVMICPALETSSLSIAEYSNILAMSRITKSIEHTGTYYNSRKINDNSSLTKRIL